MTADVLLSIGISSEAAKTGRDQIVSYNADIAASYDKVLAAAKAAGSQSAGSGMSETAERVARVKKAVEDASVAQARYNSLAADAVREYGAQSKAAADVAARVNSLKPAWDSAAMAGSQCATSVRQLNSELSTFSQSATRAAPAVTELNTHTQAAAGGMRNFRMITQQAGYQIADIAIVSQMGGMAIGQMGIQVGQFLGVLGPWGAVAGAAVTILGVMAGSMFRVGDETEKAAEAQKAYNKALDAATPIIDRYYAALDRANDRRPTERGDKRAADQIRDEIADLERQRADMVRRKDFFQAPSLSLRPDAKEFNEIDIKLGNLRAALFQAETAPKQTANLELKRAIDDVTEARQKELAIVRLSSSGREREAAMLKAEQDTREKLKAVFADEGTIDAQVASARAQAAAVFDMEAAHKAAEKAANDNLRAQEKLAREEEQSKQRYDASIASARDYVQSLDDQRAALSMSERDAEVFRAGLKVEHDLRKANGGALTEEARGYVELAKAKAGSLYDDKQKKRQDEGTDLKKKYLPQSIREDMEIKYLQAHKDRLIELGWTEEELTRLIQEHNIKRLEASQNWADGAEAALRRYSMSASNYGTMAGRVVTNGLQSMENAIVGFSSKTMTAAQAFKSMATSIIQDLIRMQVQAQITGPLSGMLSSGLSSLFGSSNAYMSGSNSMGSIDTSGISVADAGTSFSAPMAFASGTDYAPGGLSLVGEEGPELMQLPGGARIYPADETQAILSPRAANSNTQGSGGNVVQITNYVEAGASMADVEAAVASGIQQAAPHIVNAAVQKSVPASVGAVRDAANRGGSFAQAVGRR